MNKKTFIFLILVVIGFIGLFISHIAAKQSLIDGAISGILGGSWLMLFVLSAFKSLTLEEDFTQNN